MSVLTFPIISILGLMSVFVNEPWHRQNKGLLENKALKKTTVTDNLKRVYCNSLYCLSSSKHTTETTTKMTFLGPSAAPCTDIITYNSLLQSFIRGKKLSNSSELTATS